MSVLRSRESTGIVRARQGVKTANVSSASPDGAYKLRAMMEIARGAPNELAAPKAIVIIGFSPRRSDRFAIESSRLQFYGCDCAIRERAPSSSMAHAARSSGL
jgi:hypothetical protein